MAPNVFNITPVRKHKRHKHELSREALYSTDYGIARCVGKFECFPGDFHKINVESLVKLAPMKAPTFSRIDVYYQFFFVPNRLLDTSWEGFITGGLKGEIADGTKSNPVAAYFDFDELYQNDMLQVGSVCDDFGLPVFGNHEPGLNFKDVEPITAYPFLAYWKIFSDWYRDEQLSTIAEFEPVTGGKIPSTDFSKWLSHWVRPWKKDYFTSARKDVQLGNPVPIPVDGAEIVADGDFRFKSADYYVGNSNLLRLGALEEEIDSEYFAPIGAASVQGNFEYGDGLSVENATILINQLREALSGQRWSELNMRGGNRYIENIYAHFNVRSSDARLQRSQYLGGRKIPVVVGEVLSSVDTADNADYSYSAAPGGTRYGVGNSVGSSGYITHFAEEHGWILCIQSIMPHALYYQGIPRCLSHRWSRFHYLWPEFVGLGEQAILNSEIYCAPDGQNGGEFGYQPQYQELRWAPNEIHGEFRTSLLFWTTARKFSSRPALNQAFIQLDGTTPTADGQNRIFAVESGVSHFYCHLFFDVSVLRLLSKYGVPSL